MHSNACASCEVGQACCSWTYSDDTLQDEKAAMELRVCNAISSNNQLAEQLQSSNRQVVTSQEAQEAMAAQLKTAQVQHPCHVPCLLLYQVQVCLPASQWLTSV